MDKTNKNAQKTFWPYGILGVILFGVVFIVCVVWFSLKHPVADNMPFFLGHNDTDSSINDILNDTKALQEHFNFYIQANASPTQDDILKPYSPYLRPPHRDKIQNNATHILSAKTLNTINVLVVPIDGKIKDLKMSAFIQKIGSPTKQEIFIFNPKDNSFTPSKPEKKGAHIRIGDMTLVSNTFISPAFEIGLEGRFIVALQIFYNDKTIVLEKEFLSLEQPN